MLLTLLTAVRVVMRNGAMSTAIKIETTAPQSIRAGAASKVPNAWLLFCVLVLAIKLLFLWLDSTPKLYMGDSGSYIRTALIGSIPRDRAYFHGRCKY